MPDTEQKTPNKTGASGAAWSDNEKIAYLIVLCENEGKIDAKISNAPVPAGRSIVSCKKLLWRLKEKHKDDIEKIKAGQALATPAADGGAATPDKPKATPDKPKSTPRKRKAKVDEADAEDGEVTPKKKAGERKKKGEASPVKEFKQEVKEEETQEEIENEVEA